MLEVVASVVQSGHSRFIVGFSAEISLGNKGGCCPFCSAVFSTSLSASWGLPTFVDSGFVAAGLARGELGQARPSCELGTPTHADAGALTPLRAGNLHPCCASAFAF